MIAPGGIHDGCRVLGVWYSMTIAKGKGKEKGMHMDLAGVSGVVRPLSDGFWPGGRVLKHQWSGGGEHGDRDGDAFAALVAAAMVGPVGVAVKGDGGGGSGATMPAGGGADSGPYGGAQGKGPGKGKGMEDAQGDGKGIEDAHGKEKCKGKGKGPQGYGKWKDGDGDHKRKNRKLTKAELDLMQFLKEYGEGPLNRAHIVRLEDLAVNVQNVNM